MSENLYAEKLAWFKRNEKPEVVLLVADDPEITKIIVAWTTLEVTAAEKLTKLTAGSENETWEWLWGNARYSRTALMERSGVAFSESGLDSRMKLLIGNRVLYPDGAVNSFVLRYLRDRVLKLFSTKSKKPAKPL